MTVVSPWLDASKMYCQCGLKRILLGLSRQFMLTPLNYFKGMLTGKLIVIVSKEPEFF